MIDINSYHSQCWKNIVRVLDFAVVVIDVNPRSFKYYLNTLFQGIFYCIYAFKIKLFMFFFQYLLKPDKYALRK